MKLDSLGIVQKGGREGKHVDDLDEVAYLLGTESYLLVYIHIYIYDYIGIDTYGPHGKAKERKPQNGLNSSFSLLSGIDYM